MADIMLSLHQDHTNIGKLLTILEREMGVLERGGVPNYDLVGDILEYCMAYPDKVHHPKEDLLLRMMRSRDAAAAGKLSRLEADHARIADISKEFFGFVDAVRRGGEADKIRLVVLFRRFIDTNWSHMEMEETHFFPRAAEVLIEEDWLEIDRSLDDPEDPIFSETENAKYQQLRFENLKADGERC
ncbi:MAG: hemerythrin domain-containing protein [Proteobacteria bacterium]|nr:hemerythrin domain-containing protein [Pseudomonadota bacterium]